MLQYSTVNEFNYLLLRTLLFVETTLVSLYLLILHMKCTFTK